MDACLDDRNDLIGASDTCSSTAKLFWSVLATLPFLSIYLAHYASPVGVHTGFIHGDMPYYGANGRAIFERGNGLAHPNPYDPDPHAPVIYFHWLTWILGFGIVKLGLEPGMLFVGVGVIGSLLCSYLTFCLVETRLPRRGYRILLFLLAMWGGGLLCLGRAAENLVKGRAATESLFAYDPFDGWWFQNWGRNLIFPTEAVYHALAAAVWLAVLGRRWKLALTAAALLAATHPFSGLQTLLILLTWFGILVWRERTWQALRLCLVVAMLLGLFLGYYFVFLESYPQHRSLRETWSLSWTLEPAALLLAYGPIGLIAAVRYTVARKCLGRDDAFLMVCFAVSFLLAKHEWFLAPRQPLHFTRGYLWLPLYLFALPAFQRGLAAARRKFSPAMFPLLLLIIGAAAVSDNAAFVVRQVRHEWQSSEEAGYHLTPAERDIFVWIESQGLNGVLLCPDAKLSYLSATYTPLRPYFGHWSETPRLQRRIEEIRTWIEQRKSGPWLAEVDYLLIARKQLRTLPDLASWKIAYENDEFLFSKRRVR